MEMICNKGRKVKKYLTALNTKKVPEKLIGRGEYHGTLSGTGQHIPLSQLFPTVGLFYKRLIRYFN